uniref:Candidate secreted effector n=1 Tax=Meloidogyne incognita TaxID=6306 RepID=A0A914KRD5_MELIC
MAVVCGDRGFGEKNMGSGSLSEPVLRVSYQNSYLYLLLVPHTRTSYSYLVRSTRPKKVKSTRQITRPKLLSLRTPNLHTPLPLKQNFTCVNNLYCVFNLSVHNFIFKISSSLTNSSIKLCISQNFIFSSSKHINLPSNNFALKIYFLITLPNPSFHPSSFPTNSL